MSAQILHITRRGAWEEARGRGAYAPASLERDGFIHFSRPDQLVAVADAAYRGVPDLVVLAAAVDRLRSPLRVEGGFPHLYGPLNVDAVVRVAPLVEGPAGFALPAELRAAPG